MIPHGRLSASQHHRRGIEDDSEGGYHSDDRRACRTRALTRAVPTEVLMFPAGAIQSGRPFDRQPGTVSVTTARRSRCRRRTKTSPAPSSVRRRRPSAPTARRWTPPTSSTSPRSAHRAAMSALKHSFEKVGDHWEPKDGKGPSDERTWMTMSPRRTGSRAVAHAARTTRQGERAPSAITRGNHRRPGPWQAATTRYGGTDQRTRGSTTAASTIAGRETTGI